MKKRIAILTRFLQWELRSRRRVRLLAQIALIENRKVLLVRHCGLAGWHLPGGHVEPPEFPEATVIRVLKAGTGYHLTDHPELLGIFPDAGWRYLTVFASRNFHLPARVRGEGVDDARWFSLSDLPHDATPICHKVAGVLID